MIDKLIPLKGGVSSVFTFAKLEDFDAAVERSRAEQEMICGYPLVVVASRMVHYQDDRGHDVYEVYATFGPKPQEDDNGEGHGV